MSLAGTIQSASWVARATGPCCRATSPTEGKRVAAQPLLVYGARPAVVRQGLGARMFFPFRAASCRTAR